MLRGGGAGGPRPGDGVALPAVVPRVGVAQAVVPGLRDLHGAGGRNPRIPYVGAYAHDKAKHARDTAVRDGFAAEYLRRRKAEAEATRHLFSDERTCVALVIDATG